MRVCRTRLQLAQELELLRGSGRHLALVPTMGSLHEGHLSLVERAGEGGYAVAMSIFVNPLQFGAQEDLAAYPRDLDRDLALAEAHGVEIVFAPAVEEMYRDVGSQITVDPGSGGDLLCGAFRPGHFRGVLTVVAKLLGLFRPHRAVFGHKDFQQAVLVRRMTEELDLAVDIEVAPLVRDADGLAKSSRNRHLSAECRAQALGLSTGLFAGRECFRAGERSSAVLCDVVREVAQRHGDPLMQYVEIVSEQDLSSVTEATPGDVLLVAGVVCNTRLIDNVILEQ